MAVATLSEEFQRFRTEAGLLLQCPRNEVTIRASVMVARVNAGKSPGELDGELSEAQEAFIRQMWDGMYPGQSPFDLSSEPKES